MGEILLMTKNAVAAFYTIEFWNQQYFTRRPAWVLVWLAKRS